MNPSEILKTLNEFYAGAFNTLVIWSVALLAIVGALIPALFGFYQSWQAKREQTRMELFVKDRLESERISLNGLIDASVEKAINHELTKLNTEIKALQEAQAKVRHVSFYVISQVQGILFARANEHARAVTSYFDAAYGFAKGGEEVNLRRVISSLPTELAFLNKNIISDDEYLSAKAEAALEEIQKINVNGRFQDALWELKRAWLAAKTRSPSGAATTLGTGHG